METKQQSPSHWHRQLNRIAAGCVFIAVGILFLGHNTGLISDALLRILVSWQMLLIVLGILSFLKRNVSSGITLVAIGGFFLIPRVIDLGDNWMQEYWPAFLIIGGVGLLFTLFKPGGRSSNYNNNAGFTAEDGRIILESNFSGIKHIVHEPAFKGAKLNASFGSLALDLRRTHLEAEETYIELHNSFGGIELFVPSSWNIIIEVNTSFGGIDDKRFRPQETDYAHKLIIRGNISFGGVEIKN